MKIELVEIRARTRELGIGKELAVIHFRWPFIFDDLRIPRFGNSLDIWVVRVNRERNEYASCGSLMRLFVLLFVLLYGVNSLSD